MIKDFYATKIQSVYRGFILRKNFWLHAIHIVEISRWDCVYYGTKHRLIRKENVEVDCFYCDCCSKDIVDVRFTCVNHSCDFDLCVNCSSDPFDSKLHYYLNIN